MRSSILYLATVLVTTSSAFAQTPFSTAIKNYAYIGKAGNNAATSAVMLYTSTSPATAGGGFGAGTAITYTNGAAQSINAAGISNVDGFLYGLEYAYVGPNSANGTLYRVGANAVASKVGIVTPPTSADAGRTITYSFVNTAAGTMDVNGNLWFTAFTFTDLNPPLSGSKVDVFLGKVGGLTGLAAGTTTVAPTYYHLDISDPTLQTGYSNFMSSVFAFAVNGMPPTLVNGGFQDMDLRASDQKFYSYISFPSALTPPATPLPEPPLNSHLVRIDVVNTGGYWGKVTLINTTPNTNPNYEEDGAYFDAVGDFYTVFTNGEYAKVNLTNGTLGTLTPSGLALSGGEMRGDLATNSVVVPLPVKLTSFDGLFANDAVTLNWEIANGNTLESVEVERSSDGLAFTRIGTLKQDKDKNQFMDKSPIAGLNFYRLKINDLGGDAIYSSVLRILATSDNTVTFYPNPVVNELTILTSTSSATVKIFDMMGHMVIDNRHTNNDARVTTLNLQTLVPGSYFVRVEDRTTGKILLRQVFQKQ